MAYDVKLYFGTGFDTVNIPDSPSILELAQTKTLPSLHILQDSFLSTVRLKCTYEDIEGADYAKIGEYYYSIEGYKMLNVSTCEVYLLIDAFTSGGGVPEMVIDSGWLQRAHEKEGGDLISNTIPEPFTPQEPLQMVYLGKIGENVNNGCITVVQSTVNLAQLGKEGTLDALQFKPPGSSVDDNCLIPKLGKILTDTQVNMNILNTSGGFTSYSTTLPGATLYLISDTEEHDLTKFDNIKDGMTNARSIGVESAITAQYNIPHDYIDSSHTSISPGFWQISNISSPASEFPCDANSQLGKFKYQVSNVSGSNKLFIGEYNKYIIVSSCSGSKVEANPEDVYESGEQAPTIYISSDLRSEGKPYAYFKAYLGYLNTTMQMTCEGLKWQTQPLIYSEKSGNALDTYNFRSSRYEKDFARNMNVGSQIFNTAASVGGAIAGSAGFGNISYGAATGNLGATLSTDYMNAGAAGIKSLSGTASGWLGLAASGEQYRNQKNADFFRFTASQNLVVPEVNFPRSEGLRDYTGNCFYVFRMMLSTRDIERFQLFLSMYGNAVSVPATKLYFTNKTRFNYVMSDDIKISFSKLSKAFNEIAESQLRAGVRIWHQLPNYDAYYNNRDIQ